MSALRVQHSVAPDIVAQRYRLNIPNVIEKRRVTKRQASKCDVEELAVDMLPDEIPDDPIDVKSVGSRRSSRKHTDTYEDDDFDFEDEDDLFYESTLGEYSTDPVLRVYELACEKLNMICSKSIKESLITDVFTCRFVKMQTDDLKAICLALVDNPHVRKLEFEANGLEHVPLDHLGDVIAYSTFLTHIQITDNGLKSKGAKIICDAIKLNKRVVFLDLSGNGLVESDGEFLEDLLEKLDCLEELILAKNELMDVGVKAIARGVTDSPKLRILDLSWNHIRLNGAVAIGKALEENRSLEIVNLSWNGLHYDGANSIAKALAKNDTLRELDLSCTRMNEECIADILDGLKNNTCLETLRIAKNHITCLGAEAILKTVLGYKKSGMRMIDMGKTEIHDTFLEFYEQAKLQGIEVSHGLVWNTNRESVCSSGDDSDESFLFSSNPLTVLMECMRLQNLKLLDFFKTLDKNKSNLICIEELCNAMLTFGIPLRKMTLRRLLCRLDKDGNKQLDFKEMMEAQQIHRQNVRRYLAQDIDFENTEIGRVSAALRRVMASKYIMKGPPGGKSASKTPSPKQTPSPARTPSPYNIEEVESAMAVSGGVKPGSRPSSLTSSRSNSANKNASRRR